MDDKPQKDDSWTAVLKHEVKEFHRETGMEYAAIGRNAIGNSRFWERMQKGGTITLAKADLLRKWMAAQREIFNQQKEKAHA